MVRKPTSREHERRDDSLSKRPGNAGRTRNARRLQQAGCTWLSQCEMGSRNAPTCRTVQGSILPQGRSDLPGHDVTRRQYLSRVSPMSSGRWEKLTRSSGILNAAGTSEDAGTVEAFICFDGFLVGLKMWVSQVLVSYRRSDVAHTWNCTKAAGMFFLLKRTLTQHGPVREKRLRTASVRSILLRVRSRLVGRSVKADVFVESQLTLPQRCMLKVRRVPVRSRQSPRFL